MVCHNYVIVSTEGAKREATHVVSVEIDYGLGVYVEFVGAGGWENGYVVNRRIGAWFVVVPLFGIRGADSLSGLSEVALGGFIT